MKTKYWIALVFMVAALFTVSCGSSSPSSETATQDRPAGCPVGRYISDDRFNTVYVASSGYIMLSMNRCQSIGTITCLGAGFFTMDITEKDEAAFDPNECQGLGSFDCQYGNAGSGSAVIICTKGPSGSVNRFRTGMAVSPNNGY
jgi:hypothetical protein